MFTVEEMKVLYKKLVSEARALLAAGDVAKATAKMGEADEMKAQIALAEQIEQGETYLAEPAGTKAAHMLGFRETMPDEGNVAVDTKAYREFEIGVMTARGVEMKKFRYFVPLAVQKKSYPSAFEAYLRKGFDGMGPHDRKDLSEAVDSAGGYLVPEDLQTGILKKAATAATVRQYARVITTSRDIIQQPRRKYTTNNEYTSGVRLTWTGETPAASTSHRVTDQVYGMLSIPVHTAMASQIISNDLIEDNAYDVMGDSVDAFGEAFALGENAVFWTGHGAGQPRGILPDIGDTTNWDANLVDADTANTIITQDVIDTAYALPAQYERNARWFHTKATEKQVRSLTDTNGDFIWPVWPTQGNFAAAPGELMGFPRTRDEFMNEISSEGSGATYPLVLGDLSAYTIVDRVGLSIKRDTSLYSETNNTLLLAKKRVGGNLTEAYKLAALRTSTST